jgi:hypothetical protein
MQKFYRGNRTLFDAQDKFREGELGVFLRKEADWLKQGTPRVAL